jgi:hypothetical protein
LDKVEGESTGTTLGQGKGKDQYNDPRTQTEAKDHTNPIMHQGDARGEEDAGRTYHGGNTETRASCLNRTITGMGSRSTHTSRSS